MLRYALPILPALLLAVPAAAAAEATPVAYGDAARCGVLNSLMGVLVEGDAEAVRTREAMALTWFALASDRSALSDAEQTAAFDRVHKEEGEAVVAQPAEGSARADHLIGRMTACDKLRRAHLDAYRDMAELLALAAPEKFADGAALERQGREPPPIPRKDLSFGDGWTFQSRGNSCIATRPLAKDLTLALRFTNFNDGNIWLSGKALPRIDEGKSEALSAQHEKGASAGEDAEGNPRDRFDPGVTYVNFPGTAIFVDGAVAARFIYGATEDGATDYKLGALQEYYWPTLKAGRTMQVKVLGKGMGVVQLAAAGGLWAEMQTCIDQYPDG